jgi:hypothetical protein
MLLCQRLGGIEPVDQRRNDRAPARRGVWAFPFGYFCMDYAAHKYEAVLPKRLRWSALRARYPAVDEMTLEQRKEYFRAFDRHDLARQQWISRHGRDALRLRRFWYDGSLYTHLTADGGLIDDDGWRLASAADFVKAMRRNLASPWGYRIEPVESNDGGYLMRRYTGHLEIFLPADDLRRFVG